MNFHDLAKEGKLNTIDPSLLTQENLTAKNKYKNTPLHYAAEKGYLGQIPKKFLTQENLTLKNVNDYTPLHGAANHNKLHQIPKKFLTEENLTLKDNSDWTPLQAMALHKNFKSISYNIIRNNFKSIKNIIVEQHDLHLIPYPILKENLELLQDTTNIETIMAEAKSQYTENIKNKFKTKKVLTVK
jgi:ankyrin repeat protein